MAVMTPALFTGCGSDTVCDDLENFLNVEMVEVNAEYEKLTAEVGTGKHLKTMLLSRKALTTHFFHL